MGFEPPQESPMQAAAIGFLGQKQQGFPPGKRVCGMLRMLITLGENARHQQVRSDSAKRREPSRRKRKTARKAAITTLLHQILAFQSQLRAQWGRPREQPRGAGRRFLPPTPPTSSLHPPRGLKLTFFPSKTSRPVSKLESGFLLPNSEEEEPPQRRSWLSGLAAGVYSQPATNIQPPPAADPFWGFF